MKVKIKRYYPYNELVKVLDLTTEGDKICQGDLYRNADKNEIDFKGIMERILTTTMPEAWNLTGGGNI